METGTVSHWNVDRAFGFIRPDDGSRDVFLHITQAPGGEAPAKGDRVGFRVERAGDRFRAVDVVWLEDGEC